MTATYSASAKRGWAIGPAACSRRSVRFVIGRRMTRVKPSRMKMTPMSMIRTCWTMCIVNSWWPRASIGESSAAAKIRIPSRKLSRRQTEARTVHQRRT
jgi:hypothetical protein